MWSKRKTKTPEEAKKPTEAQEAPVVPRLIAPDLINVFGDTFAANIGASQEHIQVFKEKAALTFEQALGDFLQKVAPNPPNAELPVQVSLPQKDAELEYLHQLAMEG